jgi:saccharopine dehydrogenase-like NADP-dependent oxidoreductase
MKVVVLGGAGAMGQVIIHDLVEYSSFEQIVIADFNETNAKELARRLARPGKNLLASKTDINNPDSLAEALSGAFVVINSTPYYYNVAVMKAALAAGCHYLDLGGLFHTTNEQLKLQKDFESKGLLAILGVGAAPGITNVMAAVGAEALDTVESIDIIVGCVDFVKVDHPFLIPYAIDTLFDEYTLEPMVFQQGAFKAVPAMSGEIEVDFPEPVGMSPAIYTLHSEVATLPLSLSHKGVKNVSFRLGLPKDFHERLKFLVELGFAANEPLGDKLSSESTPRQIFKTMLNKLPPAPNLTPDDCEVIRVDVRGKKNNLPVLMRVETTVYADKKWQVSCGALDTGVPPSIVAQLLASKIINKKGVLAPEVAIPAKPFFDELQKRAIEISITEKCLEASC